MVPAYFLSEKISSKETPSQTTLMQPRMPIGSSPTRWLVTPMATSVVSSVVLSAKKISAQKISYDPT